MLRTKCPGEIVFILGGGSTLTAEIAETVRGRPTIALNSTVRLAPWAKVLFFMDWPWFREHRPLVDYFPGAVLTISRRAAKVLPDKIQLVAPPIVQPKLLSAGHHAVDVAIAMGARRIVLLGFDCRIVNGRSHCHDDYGHQKGELYGDVFLPMWAEYPARAAAAGVEIINASPGSLIDVFPQISLDLILGVGSRVAANEIGLPDWRLEGPNFGLENHTAFDEAGTPTPEKGAALLCP